MKIRITQPGLFGANGAIPVGAEFIIGGHPPPGWAGKYEVMADDPAPEAVAVTNPAEPLEDAPQIEDTPRRRGRPRKNG